MATVANSNGCGCSRQARYLLFTTALTCILQTRHGPSPAAAFLLNSENSVPTPSPRDSSYHRARTGFIHASAWPRRGAPSSGRAAQSRKSSPKFFTNTTLFSSAGATLTAGEEVQSTYGGGGPLRSAAEAKRELIRLLADRSAEIDDPLLYRECINFLLEALEAGYTPIQTIGFFNLVTKGAWHLAYTNAPKPPLGPRLEATELFQTVEPGDGNDGAITNVLIWHLIDEDIVGRLEVDCGYEIDPRGRMNASLRGHRLLPKGKMPQSPEELVTMLQRAIPYELFDPGEHALETIFLDESLRVVRMRGARHEGRINIFLRDLSVLSSPTAPSEDAEQDTSRSNSDDPKPPSAETKTSLESSAGRP